MKHSLNSCQKQAFKVLQASGNVFLTGAAGSGKSFLIQHFLKDQDRKVFPILASTGAAAILVGGRTFHSFFGLGILEGGISATVDRASGNKKIVKRLKSIQGFVIDEVSMLPGKVLKTAEMIARKSRGNNLPWGGLKVIAVGDFAQLPPVNVYGTEKEWAFLDEVWHLSKFHPIVLNQIMRTTDTDFLTVLNFIRDGIMNDTVAKFLTQRTLAPPSDFNGTRLFARREDVERYNLKCLEAIQAKTYTFETVYSGKDSEVERFKKNAPIAECITLKEGALIMLRQNDSEGKWVNGSLGHIKKITEAALGIKLLNGLESTVERIDFTLLDADGLPVASACNFPVALAWAVTIHKAQGSTLDKMSVDLRRLWEPGQAYVALSRVRQSDGLFIDGWSPSSIKTDPTVVQFHQNLGYY